MEREVPGRRKRRVRRLHKLRRPGAALARGYATAGSDTGHKAGGTDAGWALNHPEKIVDFGHRAVHETAVKAKTIIKAFYGDAPKRSYFSSCSNGGRQALMEAQRYPADYDGIVAGAPANDWTHLLSAAIWYTQALTLDPAGFIPPRKLPAIQAAALPRATTRTASRTVLSRIRRSAISIPRRCCARATDSDVASPPQLAALKKIYSGPRTSSGKQILPDTRPAARARRGVGARGSPVPQAARKPDVCLRQQLLSQHGLSGARGITKPSRSTAT